MMCHYTTFGRLGVDLSNTEHLGFVYQRTDSKVEDPGEETKPTPRTDRFDAGILLNTLLAAPLESFTSFDGELYVSIDNLTNSHYAYYPGYPMDGIMWYFGCKLKF